MRVAVFTNHFPSRVSTFFARDMRVLMEAGFDIDIFPFYPADAGLWRFVPDILNDKILPREKVHHIGLAESWGGLRPWPLRQFGRFLRDTAAITLSAIRFGPVPLAKSIYVYPKAWAWAQQNHAAYDHIIAYWGNYAGTAAYIFHRLCNEPVPFTIFLHAGIDLYEDQVYLRQKLLYADNIIVVCDYNRAFLRDHFGDVYPAIEHKIFKYHLGLDFDELPFEPNSRPKLKVLGVGSFETVKGFEYLLEAAHQLIGEGIGIEVELIGNGELEDSLRSLVKRLGIEDKVIFRGWLPFSEVRSAMKKATLFVLPSLGDAVPTVIKESMALGTPVIATTVGGIPELLDNGRCGTLVPPRDTQALASAIKTLLNDPQLRQKHADAARRYAEATFDLWRNGSQLAAVLRRTMRSDQGPSHSKQEQVIDGL